MSRRTIARDAARAAYARVERWQRDAEARLKRDMIARGACEPVGLTLHNWGACAGDEPYRTLHREYKFRESRIWSEAKRLRSAFASVAFALPEVPHA